MASEGNYLRKVLPGETLESIPRDAYNAFVDTANEARRSGMGGDGIPTFTRKTAIVIVRNDTGQDIDEWSVVKLGSALITPEENQPEFEAEVLVSAGTPGDSSDIIAITRQPMTKDQLGRAVITGAVPV